MSSVDNEILKDFQQESKDLVNELIQILEKCENDYSQVKHLEEYGQTVDRIMGGAKNLSLLEGDKDHLIHKVGDYAAICKSVGYKASQIEDNPQFYNICVALLLDATEMLQLMVESLSSKNLRMQDIISKTFIERLKWVSSEFGQGVRSSVDVSKGPQKVKMSQDEINDLLKKLGIE